MCNKVWIYTRRLNTPAAVQNAVNTLAQEAGRQGYEVAGQSTDTHKGFLCRFGLIKAMCAVCQGRANILYTERLGQISHQRWLLCLVLGRLKHHGADLVVTDYDLRYRMHTLGLDR